MPKIAMLHSEWNGCAHWRMFEPARFINKLKGWEVINFPKTKQLSGDIEYYTDKCKDADLIVSMRVDNIKSLQMLIVLRHLTKVPLVFETDDDFHNVDPMNISSRYWKKGGEPYTSATLQLNESDLLQFSTMPLKRTFGYKTGKPTFIMPNLIDVNKCATYRVENDEDTIRIGWAGSATHYQDLKLIVPAIERILEEYKHVRFVSMGMKCDYMFDKDKKMKPQFEFIEGTDFRGWNKLIGKSKIDIAIAPLDDIKFNTCKSNCRYLEWSAMKIPGIYTDVYPYSKTITHRKNGFKIPMMSWNGKASNGTIEAWYNNLKALVLSKDLRDEVGNNAYNNVNENYSLQKDISKWTDNYKSMLELNLPLNDIAEAEAALAYEGINSGA